MWNHKWTQITREILIKNKDGDKTFPDIKLYYKGIVNKQYDIGIKTDIDQWNRIEIPEINSYIIYMVSSFTDKGED